MIGKRVLLGMGMRGYCVGNQSQNEMLRGVCVCRGACFVFLAGINIFVDVGCTIMFEGGEGNGKQEEETRLPKKSL